MSWFTGQGNASIATNDCDGANKLISPLFDGTGGKTIFSFDYWSHVEGRPSGGGLRLDVSNGSTTVSFQDIQALTIQPFDTATDRGWQRAEVDLAALVTPTTSMRVTFVSLSSAPLSEFGVDNVKVEQATVCDRSSLRISSVSVDDSPAGWGNGNGRFEAGETASLVVVLVNDGTTAAVSPTGIMTARTPGVIVHEPTDSFPTIPIPGGTAVSSGNGFTVTFPPGTSCGSTMVFDFQFTDAAGTVSYGSASLEAGRTVDTVVFEDTFATDKGWVAGGVTAGGGIWQRGDPVGTTDGGFQANPETDSPSDPDASCYVTENGPVGGAASANDVDAVGPDGYSWLDSPAFDLSGQKRATFSYDVWYYDNSSGRSYWEDYGEVQIYVNDGVLNWYDFVDEGEKTSGWKSVSWAADMPMVPNTHVFVHALDQDASWCSGCLNDIVEMGLDNVKVTGHAQVCDPSTVDDPPNQILDLMLDRTMQVEMYWTPPPADMTHDPAAYYELWIAPAPSGPFGLADTTTLTTAADALTATTEYYSIAAVNQAGSTGYAPTP